MRVAQHITTDRQDGAAVPGDQRLECRLVTPGNESLQELRIARTDESALVPQSVDRPQNRRSRYAGHQSLSGPWIQVLTLLVKERAMRIDTIFLENLLGPYRSAFISFQISRSKL